MRVCRLFVAVIFVSCVLSALGFAQATGVYAFGPFDNHGFDTINRGNLNIHFTIPIFTKPGRGGSNFVYYLNYDGLIWSPVSVSGASAWTPAPEFGWTDTTNADYGYITYQLQVIQCGYTYQGTVKIPEFETVYNNYVYYDNHGNTHKIPYSFSGTCGGTIGTQTGTATYTLTDNSGLTIYRNAGAFVVFTSQGAEYSVPEYEEENTSSPYYTQSSPGSAVFTDTNGNEISASSTGVFTDTMGKTVLTVTGSATNSPMVYTYTDSNGHSQTVTVNYLPHTVETNFGVSGITEADLPNTPLVSSIVYSADNTSYSFSYEPTPGISGAVTGRIAVITLRTGGTISYTYSGGSNGIEPDGTTASLTRTTSDGSTQYVRSGISSTASTTTITDAMSNQTKSTFLIDSSGHFYESDQARYAGSASGTPLLEIQTCYNAAVCSSSSVSSAFSSVTESTYQNGILVNYGYQDYQGPELIQSDSESDTNTTTSYNYTQYSGQYGIPFWRVTSVIAATSGSGSQNYDETTYGYDEGTLTATSGLPQHVSVSTPRGNLTSIHQYLNSSGSSALITTMTYDDAGQVRSQTAPDGGVTSYTYDTSTDTLPTQVTLPSVHGTKYSASLSFDTNTGLMLSSTDLNGQTTTYSYDGMLRPSQISYPNGGKTTYSYTSTQTSEYRYQNASTYEDTETHYDGYGRLGRIAVANGQGTNPWYQTDTCYNADGEVDFQSYPYQGDEWSTPKVCSGAGDAYTYDALGRPLKITHADSTTITYVYDATATEVTDENGVQKIINMLDPNRIAAVCEISSNSSLPDSGSPASCNMPISGTGFLTTYTYNPVNHEITVTQGAQTRVFETDWAGRPTSVQEPESGTTTYSYAFNSTGLVVTRKRPAANQSSSSDLTTTTTQYDLLGRPMSINYSDGTLTRDYQYDTSAGWPNFTQYNLKGRLSLATAVNSSGTVEAGTAYSYGAVGWVAQMNECVPTNCGSLSRPIVYSYDWTGDVTSENDEVSGDIAYTFTPAAEVASVANQTYSLTGSGTATLVSNVKDGPFGPISYELGNGLNVYRTYDTLGRLNGQWVCSGPAAKDCSGGTQRYGFSLSMKGDQVSGSCDSIMNNCSTYTYYDGFDRLASLSINSGYTGESFTYTYDRYGNRWAQNALNGGPSPSVSYDVTTNQINSGGYTYDAAGNMTSDGIHAYAYNAEGDVKSVDGGSTAQYTYNALNQRVQAVLSSGTYEYLYDNAGRLVSKWSTANTGIAARIYWGNAEIAFRSPDVHTYFEHQDWLGTTRLRTDYEGNVAETVTSLPFGDGTSTTVNTQGATQDNTHFATLDLDSESDTNQALFRQYSNTIGSWMSPDPYMGSYDPTNPQSMNRYSYVLNNPLTYVDPDGTTGGCPYATRTAGDPLFSPVPCGPDPCDGPDGCSGGSGSGQGPTGGPGGQPGQGSGGQQNGSGNQNNNKPKSPARKACEARAAEQYQSSINDASKAFTAKGMEKAGAIGGLGGAAVGCFAGALVTSPTAVAGPEGPMAGCVAVGLPVGLIGVPSGIAFDMFASQIEIFEAITAYNEQMNDVCSKL